VQPREILGIVAGTRTKSGSTNFLRLHVLGDTLAEAASSREDAAAHPRSKRLAKAKVPPQALRRVRR
jgi:pyruvate kinase